MLRFDPPADWPLHRRSWRLRTACLFGAGFIAPAPGTWGTLFAALPGFFLVILLPFWLFAPILVGLAVLGERACDYWEETFNTADDGRVVIDEAVAIWLVYLPLTDPGRGAIGVLFYGLAGFILFRLLDIIKPWPIGAIERAISGGAGVMIDDIVAAVFAIALLAVVEWYLPLG